MSNDQLHIYGYHAVEAAIRARPEEAVSLWVEQSRKDKRMQELVRLARKHRIEVVSQEREAMQAQVGDAVHQGVILFHRRGRTYEEADIEGLLAGCKNDPLVLVLDGITDPHNLGACMRTAEACGVDIVVAGKDRSAGLGATARKAASGAAERLPFVPVTNLSRTMKKLQQAGLWVTGAAMEGKPLYEADLGGPRVIVMGSEDRGLRRLTREHCDELVSIPMQGETESLNVSVATGIVLYEVVRQRSRAGI